MYSPNNVIHPTRLILLHPKKITIKFFIFKLRETIVFKQTHIQIKYRIQISSRSVYHKVSNNITLRDLHDHAFAFPRVSEVPET